MSYCLYSKQQVLIRLHHLQMISKSELAVRALLPGSDDLKKNSIININKK